MIVPALILAELLAGDVDPETAQRLRAAVDQGVARVDGYDSERFEVTSVFSAEGRDYRFDLALADRDDPDRVVRAGDNCELCGIAEAEAKVADLAAGLAEQGMRELDIQAPPPPVPPPSAASSPVPRSQPDRPRQLHIAGGVLDAVGIIGIAAGATLLAVHGRPHQKSCEEGDVDPLTGACRNRIDTQTGGIALVSTGAAALVTGIVLHAVAARKAKRRRQS